MARITRIADAQLPTRHGPFRMAVFLGDEQGEHVALWIGDLTVKCPTLLTAFR